MKIHKDASAGEALRIPASYFIFFFLILAVLAGLIFVGIGFYKKHWHTGLPRQVVRVLPLPAAKVVGDGWVLYRDAVEYAALYAASGGDRVAFDEGLQKAVEWTLLEDLASQLGVTVENSEWMNYELQELDSGFLDEVGWSEKQYRKYVILPLLTAQKLETAVYASREHQKNALERVAAVEAKIDMGIDFNDLAMQYSDGSTADDGGFKGFYEQDAMPQGYESLFDLELGEISEMLELEKSFVIATVFDETIIDDERVEIGIEEIVIEKDGLAAVMDELIEDAEVKYWVR